MFVKNLLKRKRARSSAGASADRGRFNGGHLFKFIALAIALILSTLLLGNGVTARERTNVLQHRERFRALPALDRERYLASRRGVQFGVPKHAITRALS